MTRAFGEELQRALIERSGEFLFVVGCARSGTTLVHSYLNEAEDVCLLCEDNAFSGITRQYFREWYNTIWASRPPTKGYHIPEIPGGGMFWFDCYLALKERYGIAGSKFAFGPFAGEYWLEIDRYLQRFLQSYFPKATYLLTLRRPGEAVASMGKMFPGLHVGSLLDAWIRTLQHQLVILGSMHRARFVFHDTVSLALLEGICHGLGVQPPAKTGRFVTPREERGSFAQFPAPDQLDAVSANLLAQLELAYTHVRGAIGDTTGRPGAETHTAELVRTLWDELNRLRGDPSGRFLLTPQPLPAD